MVQKLLYVTYLFFERLKAFNNIRLFFLDRFSWKACLLFLCVNACGGLTNVNAQLTVNSSVTTAQIINSLVGQGATVSNVTLNCASGAFGTFTSNGTGLGLNSGIILTTGQANNAVGPNNSGSSGTNNNTSVNDPDLASIEPAPHHDPCVLEFDIIPVCNLLQIQYVFGSEEYPEFVNSINDAFGFFISGPGIVGTKNIALIPNTTTGVSINTVNPNTNNAYYVTSPSGGPIQYDGRTTLLTASVAVSPCLSYHMKIIVADASDHSWDSGVFFQYQGLTCTSPIVSISTPPPSICPGESTTLSATGATTYQWSPSTGLNTTTGATVIASPASTTTYTVTGTQGGCNITTASVVVTVKPTPIVTSTSTLVCSGTPSTLTASGASTYTWSTGANTASITVNPLATTTYTVTGTSNGCVGTGTGVVTTKPLPVSDAGPDQFICIGGSATLTGTGGGLYQWGPAGSGLSSSVGATVTATPANTTTYTLTNTVNGCKDTDMVVVNVVPSPVADAGLSVSICQGSSTTLTGSGATTYSWSPATGITGSGQTVTASPSVTTTYTLTASSGSCFDTDTMVVTVLPLPVANAGADELICAGTNTVLSATGGTSYTWSPGTSLNTTTGSMVTAMPSVTTTYTLTASTGLCSDTDHVVVNITNMPVANAGTDVAICNGVSTVLNGSGGATFEWSPAGSLNQSTGALVTASPQVTTTYTLTAINGNCSDTDHVVVTVNPIPMVNAGSDAFICINETATLNVTGADTYLWSPSSSLSSSSGASVQASPASTTTYTVTGTSSSGCISSDTVIVFVTTSLTATASNDTSICDGFAANLFASGGTAYSWSPATGLSNPSDSVLTANPIVTTTYTVTVSNGGCVGYENVVVTVNSSPAVSAGMDAAICMNDFTTLSATGAVSYQWSPSNTLSNPASATPFASPVASTTYTVTGTSLEGCIAQDDVIVIVNPLPNSDFNASTVCLGDTTHFTDISTGNITSWQWNFGDGSSETVQNPVHVYASAASYNVELIVHSADGCSDTIIKPVIVNENPVASFTTNDACLGSSTTFDGNGSVTNINQWVWNFGDGNSASGNTSTYVYADTGVYNSTLIVTDINGCVDTVSRPVTIYPSISADFSFTTVCHGTATEFTDLSNNSTSWSWDFNNDGVEDASTNPVNHIFTQAGGYLVTLTVSNGYCSSAVQKEVIVNPNPEAAFTTMSVCLNQAATFTNQTTISTGSLVYTWNFGDYQSSTITNPSHSYQNPNNYTVVLTATSDQNCVDSIQQTIDIYPMPVAVAVGGLPTCAPSCVEFSGQNSYVAGNYIGAVINSYSWDFGDDEFADESSPLVNHCYESSGTYSVNLTVTTNNGCTDALDFPYMQESYPVPSAQFDFTPQPATIFNPLIRFMDLSLGATNYYWSFGDGDSAGTSFLDDPFHAYADTGNYCITLKVENQYGCYDELEKCLRIDPDFAFFVPSAFSPNRDGINDVFLPRGVGIDPSSTYTFQIFNRWGELIFETHDVNKAWDGGNAEQEVYIYIISFVDLKEHLPRRYQGTITLLR